MLVIVEIDLTKDTKLMDGAAKDSSIQSMLRIHETSQSSTYLEAIGRRLWNDCLFVEHILEICGDDIYAFEQRPALVFTIQTTYEAAALIKIGSHCPNAIRIIIPKRIQTTLRF